MSGQGARHVWQTPLESDKFGRTSPEISGKLGLEIGF
jgi:hypothetical protein